jgi:DNA-directed RNA polymerase III subunit RPC8
MYDLLKVSDGLIGHGDGFVNVNGAWSFEPTSKINAELTNKIVEFRLVVFRPFRGEIITGRISSCTEQGIRGMSWLTTNSERRCVANEYILAVSVNFFSDIHIPASMLFEGTEL